MSERKDVEEQTEELAVLAPAVVEAFKRLMSDIPESDPNDATARIVAQILAAETPEELEEPWNGEGMRALSGRLLRITDVRRLPSEFLSGPGWYLGCTAVLVETGESKFVTTGSLSILAQIGRAVQAGWLPIDVVPREAEKPSRNGYRPMHLEIARRSSK